MSRLPTDSEDEEKMELLFRHPDPDSHPPPPLPSVQRPPHHQNSHQDSNNGRNKSRRNACIYFFNYLLV